MTVRRFTSRFGKALKAGFISALMHNPIDLNVFFRFFVLRRLTCRKSPIAAFLEAMRAFSSESWCQEILHQGSEAHLFRAQILPNLDVNYHKCLGSGGSTAKNRWSVSLSSSFLPSREASRARGGFSIDVQAGTQRSSFS